jgi:predicted ATP-grasp superfamily ATP-dependent carboligase
VEEICRRESVTAVLPLSESALYVLLAREADLGGATFVGPTLEQYERLCDKDALAVAAAEAGVTTPRSVVVGPAGPAEELPPLPCIVKPVHSSTAAATGIAHRTAVVADTAEARERAVARLVEAAGEALVQERIAGPQWRVHFVSYDGGLATRTWLTVRSYPPRSGTSSVSRLAEPPAEVLEATRRLVELVGYRGPGSVQLLERDGRFYAHDVNLRIVYSAGASITAGLDLAVASVDAALGRSPRGLGPSREVAYTWLGGELRALRDRLARRDKAVPARRIVLDLLKAAGSRRWVLDPLSLHDPFQLAAGLVGAPARAARRAGGARRRPSALPATGQPVADD